MALNHLVSKWVGHQEKAACFWIFDLSVLGNDKALKVNDYETII